MRVVTLLGLFLGLLGGAAFVPSEPAAETTTQAACETRASIEKTIENLQEQLAIKRRERNAGATAMLDQEIRNLEGKIVETVYKLDCLREQETLRADVQFVEITNYYATNRRPTGSLEPSLFYGKEDADRIQYGKTKITIPSRHKLGELELPTLWKLELSVDAGKHFVLKGVEPLEQGGAFAEIREALNASKSKSLLLFVHGFNVSFETAALRTAQLANDLKFPGLVMLFSWPSDGYTTGYSHDEESVELAGPALNTMLDDLARQSFDEIYLLSHSMGTRLLANVLSARQSKGSDSAKIKEIVFAAPDINSKIFERDLAPTLASMPGVARTIYASSEDLALRASKAIHEYRRIGETAGGVLTFAGFETIDATTASSFRRAWGHSYIFDSPLVIADFADAVVRHKTVARRNLKKAGRPPNGYWVLQ
jgi:esterase/lipase superfamily enzyme